MKLCLTSSPDLAAISKRSKRCHMVSGHERLMTHQGADAAVTTIHSWLIADAQLNRQSAGQVQSIVAMHCNQRQPASTCCRCSAHRVGVGVVHSVTSMPSSEARTFTVMVLQQPGGPATVIVHDTCCACCCIGAACKQQDGLCCCST